MVSSTFDFIIVNGSKSLNLIIHDNLSGDRRTNVIKNISVDCHYGITELLQLNHCKFVVIRNKLVLYSWNYACAS